MPFCPFKAFFVLRDYRLGRLCAAVMTDWAVSARYPKWCESQCRQSNKSWQMIPKPAFPR